MKKERVRITEPDELVMTTIICRKATDIHALGADTKTMIELLKAEPEKFQIQKIVEVSYEEFYDFKENLLEDRKWLENLDGVILVKRKDADNLSGIIIIPTGYSYARYAGLPI